MSHSSAGRPSEMNSEDKSKRPPQNNRPAWPPQASQMSSSSTSDKDDGPRMTLQAYSNAAAQRYENEGNLQRARRKYAQRVREEYGENATDDEVLAALPVPPHPTKPVVMENLSTSEWKWNRQHNIKKWIPHNDTHFQSFTATGRPRMFSGRYRDQLSQLEDHSPWLRPTSMGVSLGDWTSARRPWFFFPGGTYATFKIRQMLMPHMLEHHFMPHAPYIADAWSVYNRPPALWTSQWLALTRDQWKFYRGALLWSCQADDTNMWSLMEEDLVDNASAFEKYREEQNKPLDQTLEERLQEVHSQMREGGDDRHSPRRSFPTKKSHVRGDYECYHTVSSDALSKYLPLPIASLLQLPPEEKQRNDSPRTESGEEDEQTEPWEHFRRGNPTFATIMSRPNDMKVDQLGGEKEPSPPLDFVMYFVSRVFAPLGLDGSPTSPALTSRHNAWRLGDVQASFVLTGGANMLKRLAPETDYEYDEFHQDHPFYDTTTGTAYDGTTLYPRVFLNRREIMKRTEHYQEKNLQGESSRLKPEDKTYEARPDGSASVHVKGLEEGDFLNHLLLMHDKDNISSQWIRDGRPYTDELNISMRDHFHARAAALLGFVHAPPVRLIDFEKCTNEWESYLFKYLSGTLAAQVPCRDPRWTWTILPMHVPPANAAPPSWLHIFMTRVFAAVNSPHASDLSEQFAAIYLPEIHPAINIQHADPFMQNSHTHLSFDPDAQDTEEDVGGRPKHGEGKVFHAHADLSARMQFHVDDFHLKHINESREKTFMLRAQDLYNESLDHGHQLLTERFSPEYERPARILLPPTSPKHFLHRELIVQWTLSNTYGKHRRRQEQELEQYPDQQTSNIAHWLDQPAKQFSLESFSSIDLEQTTRLSYAPFTPDHSPVVGAQQTVSESVPANTQNSIFILHRESVLFEVAADTGARVLRQYVLSRNHPGDAKTAKTVSPRYQLDLQGGKVPHLKVAPTIDIGGRYVVVAQRDDNRLIVLDASDQTTAITKTHEKTSASAQHPISGPVQAIAMDHDALTYTLQNNSGQVVTLRNWQQQSWGTHEVAGTTTVGTPQVDLLTCSLGFYAWYDRNAHSIFAQFQSPAVVTSTPPVSISLGTIPGIDLVTSLSIQRVNRRLYILYGSENGHAGLLEVEYSGDGTSVDSTLQKIESQPIVNNANVESIGFGNDGGEAGHWRIVENTFLQNLEALYTLNETSSGSGTTVLSPTSNSASTTSLVQNGGQVGQDNGVFPRVNSDTVHFATATDRLRIPRTVVEKNAGVLHDEFSVSLWFRHYSNINYGVVFQSSVDDSSAYVIQLESGGGSIDLRLYLNNSAVTTLETDVQSDDTFSFTEWTLLTVTVDKDGDITIYVNDKQAYNAGVDNTVWGDMVIGAGGNASGSNTADDTFVGYVDYIGVWTQRRLRLLDVHLWFNGQRGLPPVYLHKYTSDDHSSSSLTKQQKKYLKYVYVSGHDGTVHLWDTQRNVVLWEYRLTEEKRSEAKYTHPSGITDFVSISPVHSAGTPSAPSHMAHPADLIFVRHLRPHMDPQVLGRTVAYPTYAKDGPDYRVIVSDTSSRNSEYPSDTFLKYIYEFPHTFAEAYPASSRPTNVLYDDATRNGMCVFPFGRLQSQEQWSLLLTGNAWTLAWWNRLGSFLFADEPTRHTVHTIPLMSIGNAERNLRIRLRYEKDMRTNTLSSDVTHYYRLNDIDGKTGSVQDLGTAQVNAVNKGAALHTTDKLPLNAASQALNNSNYAASDNVTVFPSDAMHTSSSVNTYIDATGAFAIPSETTFSLSMWMHPSLNRTTSDDSPEILFRNAPLKQTTQYVEISYNPSSDRIHLQVRDRSQFVELEASVPDDACMSTYNSGGHPWMFIMVTRDSSNLIHLYVNDEEQSVSSTAVTGNLYTSGTERFVGYNFQGALRDVGYWEGHDFSTQPLNRDILYNYGEIRTYPFNVPYHQSWRLETVFVHPNGPSPSQVVFDEHVRTPINMHAWAKQWQAMSLEWEVDWASHEHVFRVWHGNGYSRNTMETGSHSLYEVTVDRKDYPALFSPDTQLWFGATPTKDPFDTPTHGYPQPCVAHVAAWTRLLHTAERSFFFLGDRETTTAATQSLSSERGTAIREAHPLDFSQYGPQRASERAGEVNEHRDISRNPHRRWMLLLSHEDWEAPIACTMQPVQPHLEEKFYEELQTKGQPSDLQNALSKNGAQVVYYTWGEGNTERPDSYGNQEVNYATAQNVWEKDPDKQTPLRT